MSMSMSTHKPLSRDPKMRRSRAMTGNDIRHFDVYCPNPYCASVVDRYGQSAHPRMNYHGTKFALFSQRRIHVFACSLCQREARYQRKWFGKQWKQI